MAAEDVDTIRRLYEAWLAEDYETVFQTYDEAIHLNPDPEASWVGIGETYDGHEGIRRYMSAMYEAFDDYRPEVEDIIDVADGRVLTLAIEHGRGRGSGAQVESPRTAHLGRCARARQSNSICSSHPAGAYAALGMSEPA